MTDEQLIQEYLDTASDYYPEEAIREYAEDIGGAEFLDSFEEAYQGEWDSEVDFATQLADDLGMVPEGQAGNYFDYEAFARDLFCGDYFMTDSGYVFRSI